MRHAFLAALMAIATAAPALAAPARGGAAPGIHAVHPAPGEATARRSAKRADTPVRADILNAAVLSLLRGESEESVAATLDFRDAAGNPLNGLTPARRVALLR